MNKELLQLRLNEIERSLAEENIALQQRLANINLLNGGKQECLYWLEKILQEERPAMSLDDFKTAIGADSVEVIDVKL